MPYVALPPVGRESALAMAEARWAAMVAARPERGPAISLQRALIRLVIDLRERFTRTSLPRLSLPPRYVTAKLGSGIPAMTGEPIPVPADLLRPTLVGLCRALAETGGGDATLQLRAAVEGERLNVPALLTLAFRREQGALRTAASAAGLGHDLLWLVADLATSPFANALLDVHFGSIPPESALASALDAWPHGYCPFCGSWPALIELVHDARRLRCQFCAAAWELTSSGCLYCGEVGDAYEILFATDAVPNDRVEMCRACRGYTKTLDTASSLPFPLLALADLDSMDLDLTAMQHGCARPAMKRFARH